MLRIAFVGLPLAALLLRHDGHEIVYAGICRRSAIGTRRLARRLGGERVRIVPDLARDAERIRQSKPDLFVSWFWTKNVPADVRAIAPLGTIGVHPSLLPRHRGPDPYYWAIAMGDTQTGVTAHALADEYDTGDIFGSRKVAIDPSWNAWTLAKKLDRPSLALLRETVARFASDSPPTPQPQDLGGVTSAPAPSDNDLEIVWAQTSEEIDRRVRAAAPWPGAFTSLLDRPLVLLSVRPTGDFPRALVAGEAAVRNDGRTVIRTGNGAVEVQKARWDDADDPEKELSNQELAQIVREATTLDALS